MAANKTKLNEVKYQEPQSWVSKIMVNSVTDLVDILRLFLHLFFLKSLGGTYDPISGSWNGSFRKKQKHTSLPSSCGISAIIPAFVESPLSFKLRFQALYTKDGSYFHVSLSDTEIKNIHHSKHSCHQTSSSISLLSPRFRLQAVNLPVSCVPTCVLNDAQHRVSNFRG